MLAQTDGSENPYMLHQELGNIMTSAATVVRKNDQLDNAIEVVNDLAERAKTLLDHRRGSVDESKRRLHQSAHGYVPVGEDIAKRCSKS